jgi:hypothetical protein
MTRPMNRREVSSWVGLRRRIVSFFEDRYLAGRDRWLNASPAGNALAARELRKALRSLPSRMPPVDLTTKLLVIASRESQRRRAHASWAATWNTVRQDVRLWANNLMRPLAVPTAGGLISALLLFGVLAPNLAIPRVQARTNDIPTVLYTNASVKNFLPIGFEGNDDVVVEITVDEHGKLVDYTFPNSDNTAAQIHQIIENQILFTEFRPATSFGRTMSGKLKITFVSSRIDVKG